MQNPELDVRRVRTTSDDKLFLDLVEPFISGDKDQINHYRLKHIVPCDESTAYAVYEADHNILAIQFYYKEKPLMFGDEETVQFMSMDEIRLLRELGEVTIDGITYTIENTIFNIVDGAKGYQHMIIFLITLNY